MKNRKLINRIDKIRGSYNDLKDLNEEITIKEVILPIVTSLGWNANKNIGKEIHCENGRIDILLTNNNNPKVIIEAKRPKDCLKLHKKHKEQLSGYLESTGVKVGVLTDGFNWEFYLPRFKNQWRMKRFYLLDLIENQPNTLHNYFMEFLYRDNIINPTWSRNIRKNYEKYSNDNSLMALPDSDILTNYENLDCRFKFLTLEEKFYCIDLGYEAGFRKR